MRLSDLNWRPLVPPAVAAAIAALALAATVYGATAWLDERRRAFDEARGALARAASQFRSATDDQAVYEQYAARFREIGERGWIGPEQRLTWLEGLQAINADLELPRLRYEIARRQRVPLSEVGFDASRFRLHGTPMRVTVGALHEGDILTLLQGLAARGQGLMALRGCRLERARRDGPIRMQPGVANVTARCALNWYALEIQGEEGAGS